MLLRSQRFLRQTRGGVIAMQKGWFVVFAESTNMITIAGRMLIFSPQTAEDVQESCLVRWRR